MRRTGQWLRFIGLLIEMTGVLGVVRERSGQAIRPITVGGSAISIAWVAVALGFGLWLIGKILIASARAAPANSMTGPRDPSLS
jgi:hypothetical protein